MTSNVPELLPFIRTQFSKLKVVSPSDKVYKDECVYSFDSPFSKTGLYVNITSLQGFGVSTVLSDVAKGGRLYLHEKWTKVPKPQPEGPIDAPKALAIIEDDKFDIIKEHSLMVFTGAGEEAHAVVLPNGELPEFVCNVLQSIIDHDGMKAKMTSGSWDPNDIRLESKYARNLVLLNNGIKISQDPKTWKCEESGDTQNLWLNLSTGYIGGGRKNWDGSGGSGAALKHFEATGSMYPLCVKLGTITANGADVWSYAPDEDCLVTDPLLAEHLSHWGIDIMKLEKTDKSMLEMEGDLNYSYDWSKMMEGSETMQSLNGPGYIGLQNIGSSCYLASVMQTVLSIPEVQERYLLNRENIIKSAPADPADDFATQFSKLAEGLLTDKYCPPPELMQAQPDAEVPEEYRIAPRMFKSCVAKGNSEFLSGRQQDASEYFMHFLQIMSRAERTALARIHTGTDPEIRAKQLLPTSSIFEFEVETRYQCSVTNQVKYTGGKSSVLNIIELRIPLEAATNKAEVEQFQESKKQKLDTVANTGNSTVSSTEEVKLQVPFQACLDTFFQEETVQFRNPTLGQSAPTSRRSRMSSFPRYLVVKLGRYYVGDNWVQVKVDAKVSVPDQLDLREYKATGLVPGETPMPEDSSATTANITSTGITTASESVQPDQALVEQLMSMGFSENGCRRAAVATHNTDADAAMNWIFEHMEDADFNDPLPISASSDGASATTATESGTGTGAGLGLESAEVQGMVEMISSMGYTADQARAALKATEYDIERAMDWIFSHSDDLDAAVAASNSVASSDAAIGAVTGAEMVTENGEGIYTLHAMITHIGKNTDHGHFVCHIKKNDEWALFNDEKVARSVQPPLEHGFMFLYKRNDGPGHL